MTPELEISLELEAHSLLGALAEVFRDTLRQAAKRTELTLDPDRSAPRRPRCIEVADIRRAIQALDFQDLKCRLLQACPEPAHAVTSSAD